MAKKNNKPAIPAAPTVETAQTTTEEPTHVVNPKKEEQVSVLDMTQFMKNVTTVTAEGLDPNHRIELLAGLDRHFMQPGAAKKYNMSDDTVHHINEITAAGWVAAMACEAIYGQNPFAITMKQSQLTAIANVGQQMGINIDMKALPAPDQSGNVTVESKKIEVTEEAKKELEKEQKILSNKPEVDPTKITNDVELRDAIVFLLNDRKNGYEKISDSINFMRAYLCFVNKDNKEELEKVKALTNTEILHQIKDLAGPCPYVLNSMGRHMYTITSQTKSPISAFCAFRNSTKNKKTGSYALTDQEVADYVKILVEWAVDAYVAKANEDIDSYTKGLEVLKKDEKKNEKGIADLNEKITARTSAIEHYKEVLNYISSASNEIPDTILEQYVAKDQQAMRIYKSICDSYFDDMNLNEMSIESVRINVQQHAGIIHNMFRDPATPLTEYSVANLVSLKPIESTEEKTEESKKDLLPLRTHVHKLSEA